MSTEEATPSATVPAAAAGTVPANPERAAKKAEAFRRRGSFSLRRKVCRFCADRVPDIDYKQTQALRAFVTDGGKVISARTTGNCARHQRQLGRAVKRARYLALLSFSLP